MPPRKITSAVAAIKAGDRSELRLGNLEARRDWGHARDYVHAMYLMLQHDQPDDFVVATGETHSVRDFCDAAFSQVNLNYADYVVIDERFCRPAEVDLLIGDAAKAKEQLGWRPTCTFADLVAEMVESDIAALQGPSGKGLSIAATTA